MIKNVIKFIVVCIVGFVRRIRMIKKKKEIKRFPGNHNISDNDVDFEQLHRIARLRLDQVIYQKFEDLVERMTNKTTGVLMITDAETLPDGIVPPVFRGNDLIEWMVNNMDTNEVRALYLANVMATQGYIFPVDNHHLKVENNGTYYRFQTPYYWLSNIINPKEYDYAIYLTKRIMEDKPESKLDDYEEEYLKKLKVIYYKHWLYVTTHAETELNLSKKFNRNEKQILDSQERAFWDLHKPMPNVETKLDFEYEKLLSFKEIAKWNMKNVMRAHVNVSKETIL